MTQVVRKNCDKIIVADLYFEKNLNFKIVLQIYYHE